MLFVIVEVINLIKVEKWITFSKIWIRIFENKDF